MSKKYVCFQAYALKKNWTEKPRVIIYMKRNIPEFFIKKRQDILITSLDTLVLELSTGIYNKAIYIVNLYNVPISYRKGKDTMATILKKMSLI